MEIYYIRIYVLHRTSQVIIHKTRILRYFNTHSQAIKWIENQVKVKSDYVGFYVPIDSKYQLRFELKGK
jgi:hypothetical protein